MNIKTIKKTIKHQKIINNGYYLWQITKGTFKIGGLEIITPVLEYRKSRFVDNVDIGYDIKYYNRFGFIGRGKI